MPIDAAPVTPAEPATGAATDLPAYPSPGDPRTDPRQVDMHASTVRKPNPDTVTEATSSGGLDMPSAAIGAAGGGLIIVLAAGALAWRRPLTRRHGAVGA